MINTGNGITGNGNTGNGNTGDWNTGDRNTGDRNTGDRNTGDRNTGNCNTGNGNTGNGNTGNGNTGEWNTGEWNTGDWNTGDWNTGNRNTGNGNVGEWNTGDWNTGFFNTEEVEEIKVFNKNCSLEVWLECDIPNFIFFELTEWINLRNMTSKEIEENKTAKDAGGYLKKYEYKEAFRRSYENATKEDIELLRGLPNFDAEIFKEISGIDIDKNKSKIEDIEKQIVKLQEQINNLK